MASAIWGWVFLGVGAVKAVLGSDPTFLLTLAAIYFCTAEILDAVRGKQ